ncbi:MAG TPA: carboxyl transferase domain-containing protein [Dermatophilaceae bacterium]|nr:carboxyl transferase domain-containing protein [Dermatophilaceae bacterium]
MSAAVVDEVRSAAPKVSAPLFSRIAVVNRGEPAVRLIKAVRELNAERGTDIKVVALHTEAERGALFVRAADEAVRLRDVGTAGIPYLDHAELERALRESGADAVWVGWGFVAEDAAFAELCARLGITFIGPPAEAMRRLGDKVEAKLLAEASNVPVAPWSGGPVESREEALRHAAVIGYPMILKARSGGGGRGIRIVREPGELAEALERTQGEALRSFGDPVIFMEHLVEGARHIEVQVIADNYGTVWAPGVRDCSIQRKNQKLIEESSSPALTEQQDSDLRAGAIALVKSAGYRGAGTVEFLYQPQQRTFAFLEVNTRLQVEHPITEATTGIDLVKLQILVAAGEPLAGGPPARFGHAVEARLNAEDADQGFAPAPGLVELLTLPNGPGIRVDTGIATGDVIPPDYDSMVAKIIAWGRDRPEALARLRVALRETTVVLRGGTTTKSFLLELLDRPELIDGTADTGWLDRVGLPFDDQSLPPGADAALLSVAVDVYEAEERLDREAFLRSAHGGRPRARDVVGRTVELSYLGQSYPLTVAQVSPRRYRVTAPGAAGPVEVDVEVERLSRFESRLTIGQRRHRVVTIEGPSDHRVEVDSVSHRVTRDEGGMVRSPAPAVVVAIPVAAGADVEAGDTVVVLESMKMETQVRAPYAGRVREVLAAVNSQVDAGGALLRIDRVEEGSAQAATSPRVEFAASRSAGDVRSQALEDIAALRALIAGYDVTLPQARRALAGYEAAIAQLPADPQLRRADFDLLTTFADLCELSRNRPAAEEEEGDERVHSPREHFHAYLHSLDFEREGLPESFRVKLSRALGHYGVTDLEPGPALEEAVFRMFLALERAGAQTPVVAALLERWLTAGNEPTAASGEELGEVLSRLITATQLRYPVIGDLARNVRFQLFERPVIEAERARAYDQMRQQLRQLATNPDAEDYDTRLKVLVDGPQPLVRLMAEQLLSDGQELRPMLEAMTRRYYRVRTLADVRSFDEGSRPVVSGHFELSGQTLHLIATVARAEQKEDLRSALDVAGRLAAEVAEPANVVVDVYVSWPERPGADEVSEALRLALADAPAVTRGRRVTFIVCSSGVPPVQQFTFRPADGGPKEERVIRGMHPLTGQRMDLWRLKNFTGTRLPSAEDTYLFHLAAPNNPADERLVAMAEVRDVTPARGAAGEVTGFPVAERVLAACLDGIRRVQAGRGDKPRLDKNRIFLHVWPTVELPLSELTGFARNSVPLSVGAGLEEITVLARIQETPTAEPRDVALQFSNAPGSGMTVKVTSPPTEPLAPLDVYTQKVQRSTARGLAYPYEIVPLLTGPHGSFAEYDLDSEGVLGPVERPKGSNVAGVIVGVVTTPTDRYPEGMVRVAIFGDPTKALGTVAVAECARVEAALNLAEQLRAPVEWFALSSGAKISMDSGTENMDGVARALRRIVTFTQSGGEINIIVAGINVGAQPYWNAEATMLQHTKGVLIMTPDSAMVLTGKHSLDYSGGVSAEDNFGIGGYDRVMGPNGEAQYWAPNLTGAVDILFQHYEHSYVAPGERFPRRAKTADALDRDVRSFPHSHPDSPFSTVGDIFADETNKDRKKPFDIRTVISAVVDSDHPTLERWAAMADADTAVVVDAHLGGYPVTVLGIESRPIPRRGYLPADGPDQFTAGTLFPRSSKKTARAINAASGNRPLVVLANLSGFDGSPESLRNIQLEYGAEIGRAVVNFDGPIVFCLVSRYHGGAFVVFSGALNDNMEVVAVAGSFASVIGGAPAAAVVFTRDVNTRTANDPRMKDLESRLAAETEDRRRAELRVELAETWSAVRAEKLGEVAAEFEQIHNIDRAREVGSVHTIIPAEQLRPYLVGAIERGISRTAGSASPGAPAGRSAGRQLLSPQV